MDTLNPLLLALMAGLFTWAMTSAGAALVFLFKEISVRDGLDTVIAAKKYIKKTMNV